MNIAPIMTRTQTFKDMLKLARIVNLHLRTSVARVFWTRNKWLLGNYLVVLTPLNEEIKGKWKRSCENNWSASDNFDLSLSKKK